MLHRRIAVPLLLVLLTHCSKEKDKQIVLPVVTNPDCDVLVPQQCGMPFPSSRYLVDDASTPTGKRVSFGETTLPMINGVHLDPSAWSDSDGFSPGQGPMTFLPGATTTGLVSQHTIASSLDLSTSPTLLFEDSDPSDTTVAPTLVPHFAELDVNGAKGVDQALIVRPVVRLKDNTRYIVAIRNVKDEDGNVIPASPAFAALRDDKPFDDESIENRRDLYANIFQKLEAAGVDVSELQIAWDYQTASRENNTAQLLTMRDLAFAALPEAGPEYTIVHHADNPDEFTGRRIFGKVKVPLFLDNGSTTVETAPGADTDIEQGFILQRDANGAPQQNGFAEFEFIVNIPKSVFEGSESAPILMQGHGLFSDRTEGMKATSASYSWLVRQAENYEYVTITMDMIGWREPGGPEAWGDDWATAYAEGDSNGENDEIKALRFVNEDMGLFRRMIDRGTQGIINQLVGIKLLETSLANDDLMKAAGDGHSFVDTSKTFYRGDSQGAILGPTMLALAPTIQRGYFGEPGMPYNFTLNRSASFELFLNVLLVNYATAMDVQIVLGLMQMHWDRFEGNGFVPYVSENNFPNTPAKTVLLNVAKDDFTVTPLGAHVMARALGAKNLGPVVREIYGIETVNEPYAGNAMLEFDFGVAAIEGVEIPDTNIPPSSTDGDPDPHDWVRRLDEVHMQMDTFFRTGEAMNPCAGVSDDDTCVFPPF